jgi:formylglycine-generating enzyme required for sulfatase activity
MQVSRYRWPALVWNDKSHTVFAFVLLQWLTCLCADAVKSEEPNKEGGFQNSLGMNLVSIPNGEFLMGSISGDAEDERRHRVRISRNIYMSSREVTLEEYAGATGKNPGRLKNSLIGTANDGMLGARRLPVENISWHDAVEFCQRLSALSEETNQGRWYRLPTEAEWEYACRAGSDSRFNVGHLLSRELAVYGGSSGTHAAVVGSFAPNAFGLFDMHGNVAEWCNDWYAGYFTEASILENPEGPLSGKQRVVRGGSFLSKVGSCRSTARAKLDPAMREEAVGFRIVCELLPLPPDLAAVAKVVHGRLEGCIWDYQEVHQLTEHPSRYAAIMLTPLESGKSKQRVRMFMRHEVEKGKEYVEWDMKGEAVVGVNVTRDAKNVHVHVYMFLTDVVVREVTSTENGEWKHVDGLTDPIFVELRGLQKFEVLDRQLSLIFRDGSRIDEKLQPIKDANGENTEVERVGWLGQRTRLDFIRKSVDSKFGEWKAHFETRPEVPRNMK